MLLWLFGLLLCNLYVSFAMPEVGIWKAQWKKDTKLLSFTKSMLNNSQVFLDIICDPPSKSEMKVTWLLRSSICAEEYADIDSSSFNYFKDPALLNFSRYYSHLFYEIGSTKSLVCSQDRISWNSTAIDFIRVNYTAGVKESLAVAKSEDVRPNSNVLTNTWMDATYVLIVRIECTLHCEEFSEFSANVTVAMRDKYGFLSAIEKPFLLFYAIMCGLYTFMALAWLIVCALNWRDLLRLQFCISAVIFLGLLEKALFVLEYETVNKSGTSARGAVIAAETVSTVKRALARILVMIVCIGYGIVKPRLGEALRKVVGLGSIYFVFSLIEGVTRTMNARFDMAKNKLWIIIPLALTDATILVVTFTYLIQTISLLRARRNVVKHSLYRHFSNVLILVTCASIIFMVWSSYKFRFYHCIQAIHELWVDEAFWHVLFSVVLMVIMWLWRPSANNIRYAYSPVLDSDEIGLLSDDDLDDNDENVLMNNIVTGDLRKKNSGNDANLLKRNNHSAEDELKWIDDNIPESVIESAFPLAHDVNDPNSYDLGNSKME